MNEKFELNQRIARAKSRRPYNHSIFVFGLQQQQIFFPQLPPLFAGDDNNNNNYLLDKTTLLLLFFRVNDMHVFHQATIQHRSIFLHLK